MDGAIEVIPKRPRGRPAVDPAIKREKKNIYNATYYKKRVMQYAIETGKKTCPTCGCIQKDI